MAIYQDIKIPIDGGEISARNWSGSKKTPILMLHGWLDNLESFSPLLEQGGIIDSGRSVVTMDFPGHGLSFHQPEESRFHFIDAVADVMTVVKSLSWKEFILVGHSMGGAIASIIAAAFPQNVKALVTIEMLGPLSSPEGTVVERITQNVLAQLRKPAQLTRYMSIDEATNVRLMLGGPPFDVLMPIVERNLNKVEGGFVWRTDRRLRQPTALRMTETQIEFVLQGIQCPTLYIEGSEGYTEAHNTCRKRAPNVKNLTIERFKGSHHLHMESTIEVERSILDFIKEID